MTAEQVFVQALARASEFSNSVPATRSLGYRRIGVRQQQLYTLAAEVSPDWAGICATASLVDGAANLASIADPVETPGKVTRIEIEDAGTSDYAMGDEVHVVPRNDPDSALAPRVTIRNRVIEQIGTDLEGVLELMVFYSRIPLPLDQDNAATDLELPEPHQELLIVDLAKQMVQKTLDIEAAAKTAILTALAAEEKDLLAVFMAYVAGYAASTESRFDGPLYAGGAG